MARHKRMQYEPPHKRKRRRGKSGDPSADRLFLSRRMLIAKGGLVAAFGTLAGRLGYLQLYKGSEYETLAKDNVIRNDVLPAARGAIRDRAGRPLAQNRRAWEVRVVKGDLPGGGSPEDATPEERAARQRVFDTLISALQLEDVLVIRPTGVPDGSEPTIYQRVAVSLGYPEEFARQEMSRWANESDENELVLVTNLTIDDAARFRAQSADLPGVEVMNELEYLVENIWSKERPITIKRDVPREVAMKLETNSMYLPGVEVDGTALAREYLGGDVMSHVIGYVQRIDKSALDDLRNRDRNNNRIYDQNDFIGTAGLERALEADLRGERGVESVEVDAHDVVMRKVENDLQPAVAGKNITLTIDLELQLAAGKALQNAIKAAADAKIKVNKKRKSDGKREWKVPNAGSVVAHDPRNGDVLAMVSYPYYDNQLFVTGLSGRKWKEYTSESYGKAFLNRSTNELYPPGSTFKIFLAASALHHGTVKPDSAFTCRGAIKVPDTADLTSGQPYACWVGWIPGEHGELDLFGAIRESCDVYFYNVATEQSGTAESGEVYYYDWNLLENQFVSETKHPFGGLGIDKLAKDMKGKFWFEKPTGIEISEVRGLFPDEQWKRETKGEGWSAGDTINISIGQGDMQVTPLQLAVNTGAIGNGGTLRRPHLVLDKTDAEGKVETVKPEELGKLGIKADHMDVVIEGMRQVTNEPGGTAFRSVRDDPKTTKWPLTNPINKDGKATSEERIIIAGKTGTAEFGEEDDIGARDTHAWFTSYAPLEKPEIAVSVVIEAGGEGATFAVPVADAVIRAHCELTGTRKRGKVLSKDVMPIPEI